jgi:predicted DsbA family dithiol-disulfide isomerase
LTQPTATAVSDRRKHGKPRLTIGDRQTLLDVAAKASLDRAKAESLLNSDDGLQAIKDADALARRFRVDGVPFFVINSTLTLSGAQQPDAFLEAFKRASAAE